MPTATKIDNEIFSVVKTLDEFNKNKALSYVKFLATEEQPTSKQEIIEGMKEAIAQVKLHKQGKIKLKPFKELLDEL